MIIHFFPKQIALIYLIIIVIITNQLRRQLIAVEQFPI
jgi:hypothetical protein